METYIIERQDLDRSVARKIAEAAILIALSASTWFLISLIWPSHEPESIRIRIAEALFWGCLFTTISLGSTRKRIQKRFDKVEVTLDGDLIMSSCGGIVREVRRGEIRTFIERKRGLLLSRYGRIRAYLWGGVWVPKALPEYEYIKGVAVMWRKSD